MMRVSSAPSIPSLPTSFQDPPALAAAAWHASASGVGSVTGVNGVPVSLPQVTSPSSSTPHDEWEAAPTSTTSISQQSTASAITGDVESRAKGAGSAPLRSAQPAVADEAEAEFWMGLDKDIEHLSPLQSSQVC